MAEGDGAAVDVDLVGVPAEVLVHREGLGREGLVGLDQVEVVDRPAGLLQSRTAGRDRAGAHDRRIDAAGRPGDDPGQRRDPAAGRGLRRHQDHGGGAVVDPAGVAGGHRAFLVEGRPQLRQALGRGAVLGILVAVDDDVALSGLDRHRDDLVLEAPGGLGGLGLLLRAGGEGVLLVAGQLPLARHVLGRVAHVVAVDGAPQSVLEHGVEELDVAHLGAVAQVRDVGRLAHALLAAGDDDVGVAQLDGLVAQRDAAQAGATELVDLVGGALDRDAGLDRRLARRVLAGAGGQDLTQDRLVDLLGVDFGPLHRFLDRHGAQIGRGDARKSPVERADRRTRRPGDDHFCHGCHSFSNVPARGGSSPASGTAPDRFPGSSSCGTAFSAVQ